MFTSWRCLFWVIHSQFFHSNTRIPLPAWSLSSGSQSILPIWAEICNRGITGLWNTYSNTYLLLMLPTTTSSTLDQCSLPQTYLEYMNPPFLSSWSHLWMRDSSIWSNYITPLCVNLSLIFNLYNSKAFSERTALNVAVVGLRFLL